MTLRDYQKDFIAAIRRDFAEGSTAPLAVAPTGAGKTKVMSFIVNAAQQKGNSCGIIVHRQELVVQTSLALAREGVWHRIDAPDSVRRYAIREQIAEFGRGFYNSEAPSSVASIQTIARRLDTLEKFDLGFLDEGHHAAAGTWRRLVDAMPDAKWLGLTATPERLDGKGLGVDAGGIYTSMVQGPTVGSLIEAGWLAKPRVFSPPVDIDVSKLRMKGGDVDQDEAAALLDTKKITGNAIEHYARICNGQPFIAFCANVKHAKHVADEFVAAGYRVKSVDGNTPDVERHAAIRGLGDGTLHGITSCNIVNEGTDVPIVAAAILLRPTKSIAMHRQQMGRVLRRYPGKDFAYIIDHVGNCGQTVNGVWRPNLGFPDDEIEWSLDGRKKRKGGAGERDLTPAFAVTICLECFASFLSSLDFCPHCGTAAPTKTNAPEQVDGELIEVDHAAVSFARKREQGMAKDFDGLVALFVRRDGNTRQKAAARARIIIEARKRKDQNKRGAELPFISQPRGI